MTKDEWYQYGLDMGFIGPSVCITHDGYPTTADEDEEFEQSDPCLFVVRIYEDHEHRLAVESNHAPSVWRR
jgi:hypothetical protein